MQMLTKCANLAHRLNYARHSGTKSGLGVPRSFEYGVHLRKNMKSMCARGVPHFLRRVCFCEIAHILQGND